MLERIRKVLRRKRRRERRLLLKRYKKFRDGELVITVKIIQKALPSRFLELVVLPELVSLRANWVVVPITEGELGEINENSEHPLAKELRKLELTRFRVKRKSLMIEPREITIKSFEDIWETTEEVARLLFKWKKSRRCSSFH